MKIKVGGSLALIATLIAVWIAGGGNDPTHCTRTAETNAELVTQFAAAAPGDVLCLTAAVNYGTFTGGVKAAPGVLIVPDHGIAARMRLNFSGAQNITIDGAIRGGTLTLGISGGANFLSGALTGITLRNFRGARRTEIDKTGTGTVTVDHADFTKTDDDASIECRFCMFGNGTNMSVTNSLFKHGEADGIRADATSSTVGPGNQFIDLDDLGNNHADPIQICCGGAVSGDGTLDGPGGQHITGNYFDQAGTTGPANVVAYIGVYDSTHDLLIDGNVFRAVPGGSGGGHGVGWAIALYSDRDSIIRNNTAERGTCDFSIPCGHIDLGHKPDDNAGAGTRVYDNVISEVAGREGTQAVDHNLVATATTGTGNVIGTPVFTGPSSLFPAGWCLASGSPGIGIASTGGNAGIGC